MSFVASGLGSLGESLGDVGNFLFGESGQPGQVIDTTPEEFEALRAQLAEAVSQQIANPQTFQGQMVAPLAAGEQQILQQLRGFMPQQGVQNQALQALQGLPTNLLNGPQGQLLNQTLSGAFLSPDSNPFLQASIETAQRPILEQFGDQTQALRAQFARAGHTLAPEGSSPFDMAQARLAGDVAGALGDVGTRLAGENLARERGLQSTAVNQMLQALTGGANIQLQGAQVGAGIEQGMNEQTLNGLLSNLQAQALPRMIEDMGLQRGLQEFQRQQQQLLQALGISGGLSMPQTQVLQGMPATPGFVQSLAQGFGQGAGQGIGSAFAASDRRLKRDIRRIGTTPGGLPLYEYRYFWGGPLRRGVMSDDVVKRIPEAVHTLLGFDVVDYSKVT